MRIILRRGSFVALAVGLLATSTASAGLLFNPVVTVVGDGTNIASGVGVTTTDSVYLNSVASQAAPFSSATYNNGQVSPRLVNSFSASSEGTLTNNPGVSDAAAKGLSFGGPDFVYNAGYDAPDNTAAVNGTTANANRSLGQINVTASLATGATVLKTQTQATAYNNNNIRGATGDNTGANIYSAGTGATASTAGWRNFTTNTLLTSTPTPTNVRTVELLGGKLYGSTGSGATVGIYQIDATGATNATTFVTTGTSSDHSPYEFALFDDPTNANVLNGYNVAYIADDSAAVGVGGIEKWTYNGTTWSQAYILRDANLTTGLAYRGLAGELDASTGLVTLFASTSDGLKLQQVTDTGASSAFTTLASLATADNRVFRGVALAPIPVPEPSTCVLAIMAVGGVMVMRRRARLAGK